MNILLTNDDGVSSPGISLLAGALRVAGHRVFTLAPDCNRSGVSHAISFLNGPCKLTEIEEDTWSCSGTPADCVILALMGGLPPMGDSKPDLVISGINRGANLGTDIVYSGTAAAARQAVFFGIPALALSLVEGERWYWETVVSFAVENLEEMRAFWKADTFINVNFPNREEPPLGFRPAFPARRRYNDSVTVFKPASGGVYCFTEGGKTGAVHAPGSDYEAVAGNYASMSSVFIYPVSMEDVREKKEKA